MPLIIQNPICPILRLDIPDPDEIKDREVEIIEEHEASQEVWHAVNKFLYEE